MTVDRLGELGHDVKDIRGTADEGLTDAGLWDVAIRERRLLITTDKGFTEYRAASHSGILIVRLRQPSRLRIHQSVMLGFERFSDTDWPGLLVAIRKTKASLSKKAGADPKVASEHKGSPTRYQPGPRARASRTSSSRSRFTEEAKPQPEPSGEVQVGLME